jgi:hypothetical protein
MGLLWPQQRDVTHAIYSDEPVHAFIKDVMMALGRVPQQQIAARAEGNKAHVEIIQVLTLRDKANDIPTGELSPVGQKHGARNNFH